MGEGEKERERGRARERERERESRRTERNKGGRERERDHLAVVIATPMKALINNPHSQVSSHPATIPPSTSS